MNRKYVAALAVSVFGLAPAARAQLPTGCTQPVQPPLPAFEDETFSSAAVAVTTEKDPPSTPAASAIPVVSVMVGGQGFSITNFTRNEAGNYVLPFTVCNLGNGNSFSLSALGDPDPFVNFVFGSTMTTGSSMSFDVLFSTPFVGGPYNQAMSSGGVTVTTAGGTTGTVAVAPYTAYIRGYWTPDPTTTPLINLGVNTGTGTCSAAAPISTTTCTQPNVTAAEPGITGSATSVLYARLSYTHSSAGDTGSSTVGWTGGVELTATAVPEPATLGLMTTGVLLLAGVGLRRKKNG